MRRSSQSCTDGARVSLTAVWPHRYINRAKRVKRKIIKKWCKENGACALGSLCVGLVLLCVVVSVCVVFLV